MKKIRTLGLMTALALALAALGGAGTALASSVTAPAYPVSITGQSSGGEEVSFSSGAGWTSCTGMTLAGVMYKGESNLTATPSKGRCTMFAERQVDYNGCQFTLHFGSDAGHFDRFSGTLDIGPAGCGPVELTPESLCEISILPQEGLAVSFENSGSNVALNLDATGVKYTHRGAICGTGSGTDGQLHSTRPLYLSGSPGPISIQEDPHSPLFEAESYPAAISGSNLGAHVFSSTAIESSCQKAAFTASLSGPGNEVTVTPSYDECEVAGIPDSVIDMNGCTYGFHVSTKIAAGRYGGSADINCPVGMAIEGYFPEYRACTWVIPAQSGLSGVEFINNSSSGHQLEAKAAISGIKYSIIANLVWCPYSTKSYSSGKLTANAIVKGAAGNGIRVGG